MLWLSFGVLGLLAGVVLAVGWALDKSTPEWVWRLLMDEYESGK